MDKSVLVDVADGIGLVTLNRPGKLNAWDTPMRERVAAELKRLDRDESVRVVIMTGAGDRAFSAGQDLAETEKLAGGHAGANWFETWKAFYAAFRDMETPLVGALNGVAAGSAFQVAMMMDVRVGHKGVRMGQPEINSGIPTVLGSWLMNERLGLSRTIELTLTGRMMDGEECHSIGLIHHLVPAKEVMPRAREVAAVLASKPPIAMRLNKRRFRALTQAAFEEACKAGVPVNAEAFASGEPQAAMAAFFAERQRRKKGA